MAIRRTDVPLAPRLTLVVLFDEETRRVSLRMLRELNGRREFESPRMTVEAVEALAKLRRQEEHAYLIVTHPSAVASIGLLVENGRLYVHWDGVDYKAPAEEFAKAIKLPFDPHDTLSAPPAARAHSPTEPLTLDDYVDVEIVHPRTDRRLRVAKSRGMLAFGVLGEGVAYEVTLRRDNLDVRDEALSESNVWLTTGGVSIRRLSGGRCGLYLRGHLLGNVRLPEIQAAITKLGIRLAPEKPVGQRNPWEPKPRDDEWCRDGS